jgi:hypothetical protein
MRNNVRFPLMALGLLALLTVLWGGLVRLGWPWPVPLPTLFMAHGPLMVCGFLGTLIGVERAMVMCPVSAACLVSGRVARGATGHTVPRWCCCPYARLP